MNDFYEKNKKEYFASTVGINPKSFLAPFTKFLKPEAKVLDIGCGSGRDLLWLSEHGFLPTGFERSPGLTSLAKQHSHCPVIEGDFCSHDFSCLSFDALVLIGALVHVARTKLSPVLKSICQSLVPSGFMLLTLKEGVGSKTFDDGRNFTLWSTTELESIFIENNLEVVDFSRSISKLRADDVWLGYVLRLLNGN
ncbi:MAG: SAM-dependent methyltransferase [Desulforhopalus sp.]